MLKGSLEGATKNTATSSCTLLLVLFLQKTDPKEKFKQSLDTCLMCDKPKLTLQTPLAPLMAFSHPAIITLHCPTAGTGHCPFLASISFSKAFYYYFCYSMKCLAQLRQVPEQCEVWEHQTRLCPSCPCTSLQVWRCHLHHLSHSHSPKLFSYFIVLTISEGHLSSTFGHTRRFLLAAAGDPHP